MSENLLDRLALCIEEGDWPGYGEPQSVVTPNYLRREIDDGFSAAAAA